MDLKTASELLNNIETEINKFADKYGSFPVELEHDFDDDEEKFKHHTAMILIDQLDDVRRTINWMNSPVIADGYMEKNSDGKYELDGVVISTGQILEAWEDNKGWMLTEMGHFNDYFIRNLEDQAVENTRIRIR